jgi:Flp pilus assembly protein TadG
MPGIAADNDVLKRANAKVFPTFGFCASSSEQFHLANSNSSRLNWKNNHMRRVMYKGGRVSKRHGFVVYYVVVMLLVMFAFCSLAVDFGRVQTAKTELRRAADAAARTGVAKLWDSQSTAVSAAIAMAANNTVDGTSVVLQTGDVVIGTWENGAFTAGGQAPNAVEVNAHRTSARGCPIPLLFGRIIGISNCDVTAVAIARITPSQGDIGIVGIDSLTMQGTPETDSYNSTKGPYGGSNVSNYGNIGSNGDITLQGNPTVNGWAYYGPTGSITGIAHADGYGNLIAPLSYPSVSTPTSYDNSSIASSGFLDSSSPPNFTMHGNNSAVTLTAGTYYFNNFSATGGTLTVSGPVTIYIAGSIALTGNLVDGEEPSNLNIQVLPSATSVSFGGTSAMYAEIYAPNTPVTGQGTGDFYGSVIGQTLDLGGTGAVHYDDSLGTNSMPYIQLMK